jgi:transposase
MRRPAPRDRSILRICKSHINGLEAHSQQEAGEVKLSTRNEDVTIGLDLGDKRCHACVLDANANVIEERTIATNKQAMESVFKEYQGCLVIMEVGTHSPWISRLFKDRGFKVITGNPRQVRLISDNPHNTDRLDPKLLARLGRADPLLLSPVEHRSEEVQKHRALLQSRDGLVRCRTLLINQVRGMAKSLGVRLPKCSSKAFVQRVWETVGEDELFPGMSTLLHAISRHTADIDELEGEVHRLCRDRYPVVQFLQEIGGVGPITALSYVLTLEDPKRFTTSRTVGAYLGLCPRQHSSGDQEPQLRITKCGDVATRRYLVQAAHYIIGPFGPDSDLRRHGLKICERGGKNAKKRAAVAVARKLAVLMHRLWLTGEVYEPLYAANRGERPAA